MNRIRPVHILGVAMLAAIAFHLWESRDQWLVSDETFFLGDLRGFTADSILGSDAGNLVAIPLLIYNAVWELFGIEDILALRVIWAVLIGITGVLFFLLARKRAGDWLALWPAVLLLFFGAAGEVHSTVIGMTHVLAASLGLGALLCLDREDRRGDIGALLLLCAACATYTTGIAFLAGAAVDLARRRRFDPMALAIVGVPVLLYAVWRAWISGSDDTAISVDGLLAVGPTAGELFATAVTAITGTFQFARQPFEIDPGNEVPATTWGLVLGAAAIGFGVWRYLQRDRFPLSGRIWTYLAIAFVYWTLLASKDPPILDAEISRYTFLGAIMLLLVGVELLAGLRLGSGARAALLTAFAFSLCANTVLLHDSAKFDRIASDRNLAQLGVVELVGDRAPDVEVEPLPSFSTTDPYWDILIGTHPYLDAVDRFGSAGHSPDQILARPEHVRRYADEELAYLLEPRTEPVPRGPEGRGDCTPVEPGELELTIPPDGLLLHAAPGTAPELSLRRFADGFYVGIPGPAAGTSGELRLPADASEQPWQLRLKVSSPLTVCPL